MKELLFSLAVCLLAVAYSSLVHDTHDNMKRGRLLEQVIYMHKTISKQEHREVKTKASNLKSFSFKNCGDPKSETAILLDLSVTPDPIHLPGDIAVNFSIQNKKPAQSPLEADVIMRMKVDSKWVTMPCVGQIGTCHYTDFCDILNMIPQCPEPLIDHGIPCKCPFQSANYTLPTTSFEVPVSIMPPGDYFIQMNMTMNNLPATCFQVTVSFE